jgi:hypothetical protein
LGRSIAVYKHGRPETVNQQSRPDIYAQHIIWPAPLCYVYISATTEETPAQRLNLSVRTRPQPRRFDRVRPPRFPTLACGRVATLVPRKGRPMQHLFSAATPTPQPHSWAFEILFHLPQRPWRPPWWRVGGGRRAPVRSRCPKSPRSPPRGRPGCSRPPGRSCPCRPACTRSRSQLYSPCADAPLATRTHAPPSRILRGRHRGRAAAAAAFDLAAERQLCNRCHTPARQKAYLTQSRQHNGLKVEIFTLCHYSTYPATNLIPPSFNLW